MYPAPVSPITAPTTSPHGAVFSFASKNTPSNGGPAAALKRRRPRSAYGITSRPTFWKVDRHESFSGGGASESVATGALNQKAKGGYEEAVSEAASAEAASLADDFEAVDVRSARASVSVLEAASEDASSPITH